MHRACSLLRTNNRKPLLRAALRPCAGSMLPLPRLPATRGQSGHIATILASLRVVENCVDFRHPRVRSNVFALRVVRFAPAYRLSSLPLVGEARRLSSPSPNFVSLRSSKPGTPGSLSRKPLGCFVRDWLF